MSLTITQVSPGTNPPNPIPPGAQVTITGTGFTAGSRVCMPAAVPTVFEDALTLQAKVPEIAGAAGTSMQIGVFVLGDDGTVSNVLAVTVELPADRLQTYTTIGAVCGELPAFVRGGKISDATIRGWMKTAAEAIRAALLRRGLPIDPTQWPAAGLDGTPSPGSQLELINRMGAAARLAYAAASMFGTGDTGFAKALQKQYDDAMGQLQSGAYDHLFRVGAATAESGPLLSAGDMTDDAGNPTSAFTKERVF
jgi:hypothetical protein